MIVLPPRALDPFNDLKRLFWDFSNIDASRLGLVLKNRNDPAARLWPTAKLLRCSQ